MTNVGHFELGFTFSYEPLWLTNLLFQRRANDDWYDEGLMHKASALVIKDTELHTFWLKKSQLALISVRITNLVILTKYSCFKVLRSNRTTSHGCQHSAPQAWIWTLFKTTLESKFYDLYDFLCNQALFLPIFTLLHPFNI